MDIKIIATLMTFILGALILFSRSWSRRERAHSLLEAEYAGELLKIKSGTDLEQLLADEKLKALALRLGASKGQSSDEALEHMKRDLVQILGA